MTTSPNSSAEAWFLPGKFWRRGQQGTWIRDIDSKLAAVVGATGEWVIAQLATGVKVHRQGIAKNVLEASIAADLAIAEMERKG